MKSLPTLPLIAKFAAEQPRFSLLDPVRNRVELITFCSVFSFFFMYIFLPFNINMWYEGQHLHLVVFFGIFTGCGILGLTISQFLLAGWKWRRRLTNATYLFWLLGEIVLVTTIVTAVDVLLTDTFYFTWGEFVNTLRYTALIMPLPYMISLLWFFSREKYKQLKSLEDKVSQAPVASIPVAAPDACLQIKDEQGKTALSVHPAKLLMIRAEDNYVQVFYRNGTAISKELIRVSLKNMETQLTANGFARAHRSYLVNLSKVVLFKKNTKGYFLQIEGMEDTPVPVSGTYLPVFQSAFG
ncbi:LytR/AlgR family response regulator transcription factor [Chitinophaga qingshengii]|uniref:LytTR family transcriptional regulator n=1 Tax=Chitinophaga qingshengii TaxID=1569794 RepID=A0ABR7TJN9_9BACT|nr:LytTR family DNA-binding domain-containing protein [Chitinophaga qingshengii]MBC9929743.1 LytTR family transcriptional regulator [Chitinophaga qingshengii]